MTPYLLRTAGLHNTVIQRIHYGFKQWLADRQISEFYWKMSWNTKGSILCHHFPFDIYSTKHSCGLDPLTCLAFDFRAENPLRAVAITYDNVRSKAETLLEQYAKSGSLTKHNVVLALVGNDFRYINGDEHQLPKTLQLHQQQPQPLQRRGQFWNAQPLL